MTLTPEIHREPADRAPGWALLGGAGLVAHALTYWFGSDSLRGAKAIDREMQRLRAAEHR
jgi:hypothetical protein